jgi:DNA-binding NarL/FixJ family response regulator
MSEPIRVMCVDDHSLVRKGIASILANEADMLMIAEASSGAEAVELYRKHQPDVTLMDLRMPGVDGIEATKAIRELSPDARVIALTSYDGDQDIYRAIQVGVRGYLLKEMVHTEIVRAIRMVHAGKRLMPTELREAPSQYRPHAALTPREVAVLRFASEGLANKEIATRIGATSGTVKTHIQHILTKLGAASRTHAVTIAVQRGIIRLGQ